MTQAWDFREVDIRYANMIKDCLDYILSVKKENITEGIIDIVLDFCFKNDIDPSEMGDAISQDEYFKQLIKVNDTVISEEESNLDLDEW